MKNAWIPTLIGCAAFWAGSTSQANAGLQIDGGINWLNPTEGEENAMLGANVEVGGYVPGITIDSFIGLNVLIAGDSDSNLDLSQDVDHLSALAMYRAHFPVGLSGTFKIYGEGGVGLSRTGINLTNDRKDLVDIDNYGLGYTFGFGGELAVTENIAFDLGYNFLGVTEVTGLDNTYGGNFHSMRLNLVFRF
ncbi:outer membrane protein [Sulfuriroseicoccus oceanibius]|uniref:Outer membrane beta-barrel protein n=1 Tax=Sulfuriroseicoccus oceanibius TaxID=2707525 RepID=A0A6B3L4G0_9BACT|nr:outer membrane beta-barrel protein [Sulfuriroseicoccus oceanibius]QQL45249.1 outer membrane beta-barrel protein [Sulfuriroseicoccus oceanibius]